MTVVADVFQIVVNNVDCGPDEIDLHGLYVKEAVDIAEQALMDAKRRGAPQLRVIVGKVMYHVYTRGLRPY